MTKFNVGDRIKIYGYTMCEVGGRGHYTYKRGEPGTVTQIIAEDEIEVKTKFGTTTVHPNQCRKLKPKRERRRLWVAYTGCGDTIYAYDFSTQPRDGWAEFIEVRKRGKNAKESA